MGKSKLSGRGLRFSGGGVVSRKAVPRTAHGQDHGRGSSSRLPRVQLRTVWVSQMLTCTPSWAKKARASACVASCRQVASPQSGLAAAVAFSKEVWVWNIRVRGRRVVGRQQEGRDKGIAGEGAGLLEKKRGDLQPPFLAAPCSAPRHPYPTHQHPTPRTWPPVPSSARLPQPQSPGAPTLAATKRPQELRPQNWNPGETETGGHGWGQSLK